MISIFHLFFKTQSESELDKMAYSKLDADDVELNDVKEEGKTSYSKLGEGDEVDGKEGHPMRAKSFDGFSDPSQPLLRQGNVAVNYEVCCCLSFFLEVNGFWI